MAARKTNPRTALRAGRRGRVNAGRAKLRTLQNAGRRLRVRGNTFRQPENNAIKSQRLARAGVVRRREGGKIVTRRIVGVARGATKYRAIGVRKNRTLVRTTVVRGRSG